MAEITAALVAQLREITGAGLMDCKKALVATSGEVKEAVDFLRKQGIATAAKKASRETKEGLIAQFIQPGARVGALVEIDCETDFVAKNENFRQFCNEVARRLAGDPQADLEELRTSMVTTIGENIQIARFRRFEIEGNGMVAAYIHTGGKVGVLVEVNAGKEETVAREEFKQLVRDITLQIAAASPLSVTRDQLDSAVVAKEREIASEQAKNKPPQAVARIVEGKLEKYFQTACLVDQGFVKRNSEVSVKEHLEGVARQLGDTIQIRHFIRFQVGEAFEKEASSAA